MEPAGPSGVNRQPARRRRRLVRDELLAAVAEHLLEHGLHGFSLRQAAAAAGTTHKVLLHHFGSGPELVIEALALVRARRAERAGAGGPDGLWQVLTQEHDREARLLLEGVGLSMSDPGTYGRIGRDSVDQYLAAARAALPAGWDDQRREAVATLVVGVLRGLLIDRLSTGDTARTDAAWAVFAATLGDLLGDASPPGPPAD